MASLSEKKSQSNQSFKAFLSSHTVAELKLSTNVIEIDSKRSPLEGFEILLEKNILSAPVYDSEKKAYLGFLDVRDLVWSLIYAYEEKKLRANFVEEFTDENLLTKLNNWKKAARRRGSFRESYEGHVVDTVSLEELAKKHPFIPVKNSDTLETVAKLLNGSRKLHRVPVVDDEGKTCIGILSQSSLVAFFNNYVLTELKEAVSQPISCLGIPALQQQPKSHVPQSPMSATSLVPSPTKSQEPSPSKPNVISARVDWPAIKAFQLMDTHHISGIAVVDREGRLLGNTSAKDLKYFVMDKGNLNLEMPILDYLAEIRQREITSKDRHPACSVSTHATLQHCLGLLAATKFHRVFVVDVHGRPLAVVSITDILRYATAEL